MNLLLFYIVDIRFKQKNLDLYKLGISNGSEILSLTPYSSYLLDELNCKYITFHDIVPEYVFKNKVFEQYKKLELLLKHSCCEFIFRDLARIITYEVYIISLLKYLKSKKSKNYHIVYITDSNLSVEKDINLILNDKSFILECSSIDKIIYVDISRYFYKKNYLYNKFMTVMNTKQLFSKVLTRYIKTAKNKLVLSYDNIYFKNTYSNINPINLIYDIDDEVIDNFLVKLESYLLKNEQIYSISDKYKQYMQEFRKIVLERSLILTLKVRPFVFLSNKHDYLDILLYRENQIPIIFMQHGSYIQGNIFLEYNEICPADINFVFNDFTKMLFEKRGAEKVYSVGSIRFNYPILENKKKYDFLYIVYCTSYSHVGVYLVNKNRNISVDANNIYERHKLVIKLFGTKFKDKKICIKIQHGIFVGTMMYVPFLELSKNYPNITIEFSLPIQKLIPKSKYIISDYFSSDFINRELHYKRDIILFKGSPLPLPKEILEDMNKMFILVDTVDDLKDKIANIESITKNRRRYDDIIEYYSSKKCDTKKIVTEILEKIFTEKR